MRNNAFLDMQRVLEHRLRSFLRTLRRDRTATLHELLTNPIAACKRLCAEWINVDRLTGHLDAMCDFFNSLPDHPRIPRETHLLFLQATNPEEDHAEHERLCLYEELYRCKDLPAEARYLHTHDSFIWTLAGTKQMGKVIHPLLHYSNANCSWRHLGWVIGMRIPDFPSLLGISPNVATDYLARMLVHDFGHAFLPGVEPAQEALHNVVMLFAMHVQEEHPDDRPWEHLVRAECTNPFFVLQAPHLLDQCIIETLTPIGRTFHEDLRRLYCSKRRERRLEELWGILPQMKFPEAQQRMKTAIEKMCATGFERYGPLSILTAR